MIATVTLNPAIDKSVTVHGFEIGKTNRGEVTRVDAGGKGIKDGKRAGFDFSGSGAASALSYISLANNLCVS